MKDSNGIRQILKDFRIKRENITLVNYFLHIIGERLVISRKNKQNKRIIGINKFLSYVLDRNITSDLSKINRRSIKEIERLADLYIKESKNKTVFKNNRIARNNEKEKPRPLVIINGKVLIGQLMKVDPKHRNDFIEELKASLNIFINKNLDKYKI